VQANLAELAPDALSVVLQYLPDALVIVGDDRRILALNAAAESLTGLRASDVVERRTCQETVACHDRQGHPMCAACPHFQAAATSVAVSDAGVIVRNATGQSLPVVATYFPLPRVGAARRVDALILRRLGEQPPPSEAVTEVQATDPATGLVSRERVDALYRQEMARAQRYQSGLGIIRVAVRARPMAAGLTSVDLERALSRVARVLRRSLRDIDVLGRYDPHDCILLLPAASFNGTRAIVERLERALGALLRSDAIPPSIEVRLGIAVSEGYENLLLRSAQHLRPVPPPHPPNQTA
jgi:GGDEF domain-containing protein